ncbi:MAG: hydroxymethylglutaryl-CoA synthase family protein [Myxococcota bacterium]
MPKGPVGIVSFGAYLPRYRLSREIIGRHWGQPPGKGEKAVANFDEDSFTMAFEAASNCLDGIDTGAGGRDTRFACFATTSPPYHEKSGAGLLATALDLDRACRTFDSTNTLRAATSALLSGADAVNAGATGSALIAAADIRPAEPKSGLEMALGDGAAAILLGADDCVATLEGHVSINDEFLGTWRRATDDYVQQFPGGFETKFGYQRVLKESISGLLAQLNLKPMDVTKLILYSPNARAPQGVARALEMDAKRQIADPLLGTVGDTGCAQVLLTLAQVLETATPGDRILVASYGDGSDALLFRVTDAIEQHRDRRGVSHYLARRRSMASYGKYALFHDLVKTVPVEGASSPVVLWRETKQDLQFYGEKCAKCETIQFPRQRVCVSCGARDDFTDLKLARRGEVHTFTNDYLHPSLDPPTTETIVNTDGGGRVLVQMTDAGPDEIRVGLPVDIVLRKLHEGGGIKNYFWKARPRD